MFALESASISLNANAVIPRSGFIVLVDGIGGWIGSVSLRVNVLTLVSTSLKSLKSIYTRRNDPGSRHERRTGGRAGRVKAVGLVGSSSSR